MDIETKTTEPIQPIGNSRRFITAMTVVIGVLGCDTAIQIATWPANAVSGSAGLSMTAAGTISAVVMALILGLAYQKINGGGHA